MSDTSKSACFSTSSALILFKMNSASFATLTMWSFIAWDSNLCNAKKHFHEEETRTFDFVLFACALVVINVLPSFVNELDESKTRVLLQGVLPFLRAEEHNQFYDGIAVLKCSQTWQITNKNFINEFMNSEWGITISDRDKRKKSVTQWFIDCSMCWC